MTHLTVITGSPLLGRTEFREESGVILALSRISQFGFHTAPTIRLGAAKDPWTLRSCRHAPFSSHQILATSCSADYYYYLFNNLNECSTQSILFSPNSYSRHGITSQSQSFTIFLRVRWWIISSAQTTKPFLQLALACWTCFLIYRWWLSQLCLIIPLQANSIHWSGSVTRSTAISEVNNF